MTVVSSAITGTSAVSRQVTVSDSKRTGTADARPTGGCAER